MRAESEIFSSKIFDNIMSRGIARGLKKYANAQLSGLPKEADVRADIAELQRLDSGTVWRASLDLNATNKWIASAMSGLEQKVLIGENL
jgi:hypothetical protein